MKSNAICLIDHIIAHPGMNLTDLVQQSRIPQTTVHRTLNNLCTERLLRKEGECYFLGAVLLRWINSSSPSAINRYVHFIHPYLVTLAQSTGETVHLVQRDGFYAYYIDKVDGRGPIALKSKIGRKLQLYSTGAGRALLSLFTEEELAAYWKTIKPVALTPQTQTDRQIIQQEIHLCRSRGYCVEVEQDQATIQCLGVPVELGSLQLGLSITTTILMDIEDFLGFAGILMETAQGIRSELVLDTL